MDVPRFLEKLREGCQLVMGNRFKGKIHRGAMPWLHRYLGNPVLSALGRLFYGVKVGDFHCGLRGFSGTAYKRMQLRSTGMEFASEMVIKAALSDMRICEIPIELRPDGRDRPPHLRTWRDGWRHLRFMMLMCPRWLFWLPGSALYCVCLVLAVTLELGAVLVGPMRFSIHTLLVIGTAMIIAVQLMTFAIYTERLANLIGLGDSSAAGSSTRRWLHLPKLSLEWGLGIGLMFLVCGFGLLSWKTWAWSSTGFAPLDPEVAMRVVIPAIVCMTHGFQIVFGAFFLSFLNLVKSQLNESSQT
jgi:hypothetical protein